ncbi:MAG TPA: hypothetical protein VF718_09115 [Allosphingosinicella sp.]|jgi:hypothetical protein
MFGPEDGHMAPEAIEIQQRDEAGDYIQHVLRLVANVNDRWRRRGASKENQFAEIAIAGEENTIRGDRVSENLKIAAVGNHICGAEDIIPLLR